MNPIPLVTIVTPSYNQGKFLERTILSVLSQDYPNIEYIVIDGGSTDESVSLIKKYQERLAYWVSEKDRGQSDAINKGWRIAKGIYCSYLNSDDVLAPGAVSKVVEVFLKNPLSGVVYGDYAFIDEKDHVIEQGRGHQTNLRELLIDGQMPAIAQPSSFYLTSLVRQLGFIDERLHLSMDYDLLLRLAKVSVMVYVPSQLSFFRLHSNAKSSLLVKRHWHETLKIKSKYSKILMTKSLLLYLRYRIFDLLPYPIQKVIRRKRNSINDRVTLTSKN